MSGQTETLYKLKKKDVPKAGAVLADAFQHDPVWKIVLEGAKSDQKIALFEVPVRYCIQYGEVYASSEHLEGIAAWVPGGLADMTFWRMIRSGSFISGMKMGAKAAQKMQAVFEPIQADRKGNMKARSYFYLMIIGVATIFQGQGFGGKLLAALIEQSELTGLPIYLETETEQNVAMYERFGFKLVNQITLPVVNLPMWEMIREPKASTTTG